MNYIWNIKNWHQLCLCRVVFKLKLKYKVDKVGEKHD